MTTFIGSGLLAPYSCELHLEHPIPISKIGKYLALPVEYEKNLIVVKGSRVLSQEESISDCDEIRIFIVPMGG